jgi:hypothetical protein
MRSLLFVFLGLAACGSNPGAPPDGHDVPDVPDATPPDAFVAPADAFGDHGTTTFTASKFGDPLWETVGWTAYTAVDNNETIKDVFSQHTYHGVTNAFGPGTPHQPPYDTEVPDAIDALGFAHGDHFHFSEWQFPYGIIFNAMIVPSVGAPTGQTYDYADGPIIPDNVQLVVDADMYQDDTVVDPDFDSTYPKLSTIDAAKTFDGWSHMTLSFGEDTSYIPGTPGSYHLHVHLKEYVHPLNGWDIDIPFTVDP